MADTETILARLAALEAEIGALRRELHAADRRRGGTMAETGRCPACGGRKLLHALEILDGDGGGRNKLALAQPSIWSSRRVGHLQAYICAGCRLVEWHVESLADVEPDGLRIRLIDGTDEGGQGGGPYR